MEKLLEILRDIKSDVDWEAEEALFDDEIIDSFEIIAILNELNDYYGIEISVIDLEPENFNSVKAIWAVVEKYLAAK